MDMMQDGDRYARMPYRRTGRSGLLLPAITLGLWQNFGGDRPIETQRAIIRRAFDLGITHFDLANNYGPPPGSAETAMGRALDTTLFIKNGPCMAGLGLGGEGYLSYSIATPTGEGVTNPKTFCRVRRCVLVDNLRIY